MKSLKSSFFLIKLGLAILLWTILPAFSMALVSCHSLTDQEAELKKRQQIEASLTLLENKNNLIPLGRLDTLKIAALSVGESKPTEFQQMLANYMKVDFFNLPANFTSQEFAEIKLKLKDSIWLLLVFI